MATKKLTPLMKQYFEIKEQHPDTVLLFQVGDFYELFFEDAKRVSAFLAIALTKRGKHQGQDIPLCGVPIHALNHYLLKLVRGGFKVAICEQMSKPQPGKVVDRAVTQVFTPGTLTDEQMLDNKRSSYLLSFYPGREWWGVLFTELLTAQMFATSVPIDSYRMVESELVRFFPDEIIIPENNGPKFGNYFRKLGYVVSEIGVSGPPDLWVESQFSGQVLQQLSQNTHVTSSLHQLYWYLKKNQERALGQLRSIQFYQPDDYLVLDAATQNNLEIVGKKNSLFSVMDRAVTSMGSRMIKKWLLRPLVQKPVILQRQEVVAALAKNIDAMQKFEELFGQIADLERIVGRIALARAQLNDYLALKNSLTLIPEVKCVVQQYLLFYLTDIVQAKLVDCSALVELLDCALNDDVNESWTIKTGFDQELDRLRELVSGSQKEVLKLEQQEIAQTGINSLKIRYNNISGYYIEVTKPNIKLVPENYIHQQTLVNRSRYVTQALKDLERDIVKAQNEIDTVEQAAFERVKREVEMELHVLRKIAQAIAYLDGLLGFARVAYDNGYTAPDFVDGRDVVIKQGRHPMVEACGQGQFIPNDTSLVDSESIWIVTGPNMGGKSTYLRQVALLCVMAQAGSLIPAQSAALPILDRVFTRIGSGDNLAEGKSTFLVEMEETAVICNQATRNSLVILDEVGRGTSTFDGMAIAQAIIEHIAQKVQARCLFATHYHELTHMKEKFAGIENYHMACRRGVSGMLFLYKISKGVAEGSFGLEVAKLANLPDGVVARAREILQELVADRSPRPIEGTQPDSSEYLAQIARLEHELAHKNKLLRDLESVSLDDLSPRLALDLVWKLKEKH
ncbi:DNA mismatch repair protein MutS [Candidatus Dependentiae bacterium]|nr:DNA mismatch repair protein MutS [Candidatus Dependentiae bacterium]